MRYGLIARRAVRCLVLSLGVGVPVTAQQPSADPFGLTALNAAYRLMPGDLSLNVPHGGMPHFASCIYPLMSANGVELWGKDESFRADHLVFYIRYGRFGNRSPAAPIRDTDVPSLMARSTARRRWTSILRTRILCVPCVPCVHSSERSMRALAIRQSRMRAAR